MRYVFKSDVRLENFILNYTLSRTLFYSVTLTNTLQM